MLCIGRDREREVFEAFDDRGTLLAEGSLEHVMARLDRLIAQMDGERRD